MGELLGLLRQRTNLKVSNFPYKLFGGVPENQPADGITRPLLDVHRSYGLQGLNVPRSPIADRRPRYLGLTRQLGIVADGIHNLDQPLPKPH